MATSPAKILVLTGEHFACVKIVGRATFTYGPDLKTLLTRLAQNGYSQFIIDLSECALMDSTFLGILAGFGLKMASPATPDGHPIELLNPSSRIAELLENLGALQLFKVTTRASGLPENVQAQTQAAPNPTREQITRTCLEAHQSLMDMNPANVARFKEVARFLAEDLKKPEKSS